MPQLTEPRRPRSRKKLTRLYLAIFPKVAERVVPARDLAMENAHRVELQRDLAKNLFVYLPLAGIILLALNLFAQVHGNMNVALAIIQNLTFSSLALTVFLNLLVYIFAALLTVLLRVILSDTPANQRVIAVGVYLAICLYGAVTLSWLVALGVVLALIVLAYLNRRQKAKPSPPPVLRNAFATFHSNSAPVDIQLRRIWMNARAGIRNGGADLMVTPHEARATPSTIEPVSIEVAATEWNSRLREIDSAKPRRTTELLVALIVAFVVSYGGQAVFQPLQLAPLERVSINGKQPEVGYVLMPNGTSGIFLSRESNTVRYVEPTDDVDREVCPVVRGPLTGSLYDVFSPTRTDQPDCKKH